MSKHAVIIGAGVIGSCTAFYLARRGFRVTLLDRAAEGARDGCSFGNAGMIVPSHIVPLAAPGMVWTGMKMMLRPRSPFYIRPRASAELFDWMWKFYRAATPAHVARAAPLLRDLNLASRAGYEELAAEAGADFGLVKKGLLMLCKTARGLEEEAHAAEHANKLGVPAQVLDAKAAAALDPNVRMDVAGAIYFPKDCHLSPARFVDQLHAKLREAGVAFSWETDVTGWRTAGRRVEAVRTTRGEVAGDEFVLCGGVWSASVARDLNLRLPMQAGKGYSLTLTNPRQLPEICAIFTEARVAVTPMGGTLRFGGTMEITGLDERVSAARVRGIIESIPPYYPEFKAEDFAGVPVWRGLRPCSPDGLPYVGRTAAYANLAVAAGHAMMGLSLAPVTGRLVAEVLSGDRPSIDIGLLSPDRYAPKAARPRAELRHA